MDYKYHISCNMGKSSKKSHAIPVLDSPMIGIIQVINGSGVHTMENGYLDRSLSIKAKEGSITDWSGTGEGCAA